MTHLLLSLPAVSLNKYDIASEYIYNAITSAKLRNDSSVTIKRYIIFDETKQILTNKGYIVELTHDIIEAHDTGRRIVDTRNTNTTISWPTINILPKNNSKLNEPRRK